MSIEITGTIIHAGEPRRGISQTTGNEWVVVEYVIEDAERRKLCFEVFGQDRIDNLGLVVGEFCTVVLDYDARQTQQGRWFNSLRAWRVRRDTQPSAEYVQQRNPQPVGIEQPKQDQLPF